MTLPTTTRSSERPRRGPRAGRARTAAIGGLIALAGCSTSPPPSHFDLSAQSLPDRAAQTRFFETSDPDELLSASAAVFQDLGFDVEECVRELGMLRAAKERGAREHGQEILRAIVLLLSSIGTGLGGDVHAYRMPIDLHQKIAATLVARPVDGKGTRQEVRVMFYRVIWKGDGNDNTNFTAPGEQRMEMVRDPVIYQQFFARLSKSVFLEAHAL